MFQKSKINKMINKVTTGMTTCKQNAAQISLLEEPKWTSLKNLNLLIISISLLYKGVKIRISWRMKKWKLWNNFRSSRKCWLKLKKEYYLGTVLMLVSICPHFQVMEMDRRKNISKVLFFHLKMEKKITKKGSSRIIW